MDDFAKLRQAAAQSDTYPATAIYASDIKALLVAYDEAMRLQGYWHDEARRYADNASYWRQRVEAADNEGASCD